MGTLTAAVTTVCDKTVNAACDQYFTPTPTPTWWPTPTPTPAPDLPMTGMNSILFLIIALCVLGGGLALYRATRDRRA